jgi:hypothetical protein
MPAMDNPHAIRLYDSLCANADKSLAEEFAHKFPLSKSADFERKFKWASDVCEYLERNFDDDAICNIREACNCDNGASKAIKMKAYLRNSTGLTDFAERFNSKETYARLETQGESLLFIYPVCYCSCVKRVNKPISKTWCYCTLGYTKALFEKVFGHPVDVVLLESIKTGGNKCVIKVTKATV